MTRKTIDATTYAIDALILGVLQQENNPFGDFKPVAHLQTTY